MCAALAACSGSGGGTTPYAAPKTPSGTVRLHLTIPAKTMQQHVMRVSSGVLGVGVVVYFHSDINHTTPVGSAAFDASAASSLCTTGTNGSRACTFNIPAPVPSAGDSDDIVITTYDTAPSGGTIPPSAHALDNGTINVTPVAGTMISPAATLGGIPATLAITVANPNSAFDTNLYGGMPYYVTVVAADASGATIIGSDPYNTPLALTTNGSFAGSTTLSVTNPNQVVTVDAPATGTSLTISSSSPVASVNAAMTAAGTAQTIATNAGATQIQSGADNDVYVSTSSTLYGYKATTRTLDGTIAVGNPGDTFYGLAALPPGIANAAVLVGYDFGGLEYAAAAGVGATTTVFGGDPGIPSPSIQPLSAGGAPFYLGAIGLCDQSGSCVPGAAGTQGAEDTFFGYIWIGGGSGVHSISPSFANLTTYTTGLPPGANVASIVGANDGNLYALDYANGDVIKITNAGTITPFSAGGASGNIVVGPDGALYFPQTSKLARFDPTTHAVTTTSLTFTPLWLTLAQDGAFWTLDASGDVIRLIP